MANQKYAQIPALVEAGDLNWMSDHIQAHLTKGVAFVGSQQRLSQATASPSAVRLQTIDVQGRSVDTEGQALGLPATFPKVDEATPYQVILAKDDGSGDDILIAYYDQDDGGGPLQILNGGTMIVRPFLLPDGDPPTVGVWLTF